MRQEKRQNTRRNTQQDTQKSDQSRTRPSPAKGDDPSQERRSDGRTVVEALPANHPLASQAASMTPPSPPTFQTKGPARIGAHPGDVEHPLARYFEPDEIDFFTRGEALESLAFEGDREWDDWDVWDAEGETRVKEGDRALFGTN